MIISNLNHLEDVSETKEVIGGYYPWYGFTSVTIKNAEVTQDATATAIAKSKFDDATASAYASNYSFISQ